MIFRRLLERRAADSGWLSDFLTGMDGLFTSFSGETVTQSSALRLSAVYNAVNTISDDVAKLPVHIFRRTSNGVEIDTSHPASFLLSVLPNERMTPFKLKKYTDIKRQLWGHGYIYVETDFDGMPVALLPLPPEYVMPYIDDNGAQWFVLCLPGMERRKLPWADVIDVHGGISTNGVTADGTMSHARDAIGVGMAQQKFEGNLYQRGMKLGGVLETPSKLGPDEKDIVRREFEKMTSGLSNMHRVAVLDLGQKFTPLTGTLADAQFIESKKDNISDISRFWKFPLYKQQEGDQSYNANEQQSLDYVTNTLDPILVEYDQEYTLKLFSRREWKKYYARANRAAQLRANLTARKDFLTGMVNGGIYTLAEARAFEELNNYQINSENPTERLLVSRNYIFIEDLSKTINAGVPAQRGD